MSQSTATPSELGTVRRATSGNCLEMLDLLFLGFSATSLREHAQ